jgi:hypothetical protein
MVTQGYGAPIVAEYEAATDNQVLRLKAIQTRINGCRFDAEARRAPIGGMGFVHTITTTEFAGLSERRVKDSSLSSWSCSGFEVGPVQIAEYGM